MKILRLKLNNIRSFQQAELLFQPDMNLLVGANGTGKSTVLDSLYILLSQALFGFYGQGLILKFSQSDLGNNSYLMNAEITFEIAGHELTYRTDGPHGKNKDKLKGSTEIALSQAEIVDTELDDIPITVYYSLKQNLAKSRKRPKSYDDSYHLLIDMLSLRSLNLSAFADWWIEQHNSSADSHGQDHLNALNMAIATFLDGCTNIRVNTETKSTPSHKKSTATFLIDKNGLTLELSQLSDGEQGILALLLDLTRRLSKNNPHLTNPLTGQAIVLIDELDLHLHPKWQRTIVSKLTSTFPNCQFIATTHSPQIIGEVPPENIIVLEQGQPPFQPDQSLGMDTDWILKYLMDAPTRNSQIEAELQRIADLVEAEDYEQATEAIDTLRTAIGEFPELVRLQARIDRFQLLGV
jgi:predicted ATP-binding protein involved in virulence